MSKGYEQALKLLLRLVYNLEKSKNVLVLNLKALSEYSFKRGSKKWAKGIQLKNELNNLEIHMSESKIYFLVPAFFSNNPKGIKEIYCLDEARVDAMQLARIILILEVFELKLKIAEAELFPNTITSIKEEGIAHELIWAINELKLGLLEYVKKNQG